MNARVDPGEEAKIEALAAFWERMEPLIKYLEASDTQEIAINHLGEVQLWKSGKWVRVEDQAISLSFLEKMGANLANVTGKPFDRQHTSLSTFLPTGERVEMTHPPQSPEDLIYVNIRKHSGAAFPHKDLIDQGYYANVKHQKSLALTAERRQELSEHLSDAEKELWALAEEMKWPEFMERAVALYQNIIVSGATGSGKTSYTRSLIELIDKDDRIITVEDTPEMPLPNHVNSNRLLFKKDPNSAEGATAKDVMHSVMRKTPKRVLLAELRGDEAMFYLAGVLSSGHPGGITTTHANSPRDAFYRLALLIMASADGKSLDMETIKMLLYMTVHVVVQLEFDEKKGKRFVSGIYYDPMHRLSLLG